MAVVRPRGAAALLGLPFGFVLAWSGMSDPDAIRSMLLLHDPYLYLVFASAVATGFAGCRLLRRARPGIAWATSRPQRRHVAGSAVFGAGWALSASCPGPIAAQLGTGVPWSLFTIGGIVLGVALYLRWPLTAAAAPRPTKTVPET